MTCEMGCGKTLTTIAVMGAAYEKGVIKKALIVAPTSVVAVWQKELEQFADFPVMVQILFGDKKSVCKQSQSLNHIKRSSKY